MNVRLNANPQSPPHFLEGLPASSWDGIMAVTSGTRERCVQSMHRGGVPSGKRRSGWLDKCEEHVSDLPACIGMITKYCKNIPGIHPSRNRGL